MQTSIAIHYFKQYNKQLKEYFRNLIKVDENLKLNINTIGTGYEYIILNKKTNLKYSIYYNNIFMKETKWRIFKTREILPHYMKNFQDLNLGEQFIIKTFEMKPPLTICYEEKLFKDFDKIILKFNELEIKRLLIDSFENI